MVEWWHFLRVLCALCGEIGSVWDFFNHEGLEEHEDKVLFDGG